MKSGKIVVSLKNREKEQYLSSIFKKGDWRKKGFRNI